MENLLTTHADPCVSLVMTLHGERHVGFSILSWDEIGKKSQVCIRSREKCNTSETCIWNVFQMIEKFSTRLFQLDIRPHVSIDSCVVKWSYFTGPIWISLEYLFCTCVYYVIFIQLLQLLLGSLSSALLCYQEKNSELDPWKSWLKL